jgi:hypothetical protein
LNGDEIKIKFEFHKLFKIKQIITKRTLTKSKWKRISMADLKNWRASAMTKEERGKKWEEKRNGHWRQTNELIYACAAIS